MPTGETPAIAAVYPEAVVVVESARVACGASGTLAFTKHQEVTDPYVIALLINAGVNVAAV